MLLLIYLSLDKADLVWFVAKPVGASFVLDIVGGRGVWGLCPGFCLIYE